MNRAAKGSVLVIAAGVLVSVIASCRALSPFACSTDDQCTFNRIAGVCVMPQHACAFPAPDCPSGYRFDQTATGAANECATIDPSQQGDMGGASGGDMPPAGPAPSVTMVAPTRGPTSGGTTITISGANFAAGAAVNVGGSPALNVSVVDAHTITALTPMAAPNFVGDATLTVVNPDSQAATGKFTYFATAVTFAQVMPATTTTVDGPSDIVVADFNGDTKADVGVTGAAGSSVGFFVYLGNGDGTFQGQKYTPVGSSGVSGPSVGKLNSDTIPDVVVVSNGNVYVLLGNGDGTFAVQTPVAAGTGAQYSAIGDFDKNTKLDVAVTVNGSSSAVAILLGDGAGHLTAAAGSPFGVSGLPARVAVSEFNGDAIPDLAVACNNGSANILIGNGDGSFQTKKTYAVSDSPQDLVVGDFDGDTHPDLALMEYSLNTITTPTLSVLLGNVDGTFQLEKKVKLSASTGSLAVGDFNLDGKLDVATGGGGFDTGFKSVMTFMGKGDGTFDAGPTPIAAKNIWRPAIADYNGDGKPDIAIVGTNNLTVLLNTSK